MSDQTEQRLFMAVMVFLVMDVICYALASYQERANPLNLLPGGGFVALLQHGFND